MNVNLINDIISKIGVIITLIIAFGISIIPMPLIKEILSARGNRISLEISLVVSLLLFIITQIALGIFAMHWTLLMLLLLTPIMLFEAFKPTRIRDTLGNLPVLLKTSDSFEDVLCFSTGRTFSTITALAIFSISTEATKGESKDEEFAELKWLYPFWEDGKKSHITITMETTVEEGLSTLRFFVSGEDKDRKKSVDKVRHATLILETWLTRKNYDYNVIQSNDLFKAYSELTFDVLKKTHLKKVTKADQAFLGVLLVEKAPKSLSSNLGDHIQQLLKMKVKGRVLVSFRAGTIPRLPKNPAEVRIDPQHQPRISHRVEEHNLRKTNQLMAEIEACEETGAFNLGISLIVVENTIEEVENTLAKTNAAVSGILGGVNVTALTTNNVIRSWQKYALRKLSHGKTPISGARLTALLNLPEAFPGTPSTKMSPEFALPTPSSTS